MAYWPRNTTCRKTKKTHTEKVIPAVPQSEIWVKCLASQSRKAGEKCGEIFGEMFHHRFSSFNFQGKSPREISHKFLHTSGPQIPQGLNQNSFTAILWELGAPKKKGGTCLSYRYRYRSEILRRINVLLTPPPSSYGSVRIVVLNSP